MLVVSRKKDQAILIGDNIRVLVVRIDEDKVRIGIEAPNEVSILREELSDVSTGDPSGDCVRDSAGMGGGLGDADSDVE